MVERNDPKPGMPALRSQAHHLLRSKLDRSACTTCEHLARVPEGRSCRFASACTATCLESSLDVRCGREIASGNCAKESSQLRSFVRGSEHERLVLAHSSTCVDSARRNILQSRCSKLPIWMHSTRHAQRICNLDDPNEATSLSGLP